MSFRPSSTLVLAAVLGCQLMVVVDATIVNVALPDIQRALGFSSASLSWVLNAYTLTFGGLLLLGARMGDILGRRRTFLTGVALFAVASAAGGVANDAAVLLAARAASRTAASFATPPAAEAAANSATPVRNVRRRPRMSPMRAPSSSRPPNVSV